MPTKAPEIDRAEIERVIRTRQPVRGVGVGRALSLLTSGVIPDARRLLFDIVVDRSAEQQFRTAAALGLYRTERARPDLVLAEAAQVADATTAAPLALGLGRVGSPDRMELLDRLARLATPQQAQQIEFARTLLGYRHDLDVEPVARPRAQQLQRLEGHQTTPIQFKKAGPRDAAEALAAMDVEPLAVELTADGAQRVECKPNVFVWLWNRRLLDDLSALRDRKSVAGVLTRQGRFGRGHSLSRIGLATPRRTNVSLTAHRAITGEVEFAVGLASDGTFDIAATKRPGLAAVEVRGALTGRTLRIDTATSAAVVRPAKTPTPA